MKLVLRVIKTVLRNQKKLIFKNRLKHLKQKCFSVLRQKQSCPHGVKDGCKNLKRFSFKLLKPFCLSSEQGFNAPKCYQISSNKCQTSNKSHLLISTSPSTCKSE